MHLTSPLTHRVNKCSLVVTFVALLTLSFGIVISNKSAAHAASTTPLKSPRTSAFPKSGSPNTSTAVSGKNFGAREAIAIVFDTTQLGTTTTDSTGAFPPTNITIPKTALPGNHTITATGQTTHLVAQATFLVSTDWSLFGFDR